MWTDTPADKEKKRSEKRKQAEEHGSVPLKYSKHDQEVRQNVHKHNVNKNTYNLIWTKTNLNIDIRKGRI